MVDPCDGLTLIKRDGDDSTEIDRDTGKELIREKTF